MNTLRKCDRMNLRQTLPNLTSNSITLNLEFLPHFCHTQLSFRVETGL